MTRMVSHAAFLRCIHPSGKVKGPKGGGFLQCCSVKLSPSVCVHIIILYRNPGTHIFG